MSHSEEIRKRKLDNGSLELEASLGTHTSTQLSSSFEYSVTFNQQRLWLLEELYPGRPQFIHSIAFSIEGDLNIEALEKSIEALINRHEALRATVKSLNGQLSQLVHSELKIYTPLVNLQEIHPEQQELELSINVEQEALNTFDLKNGPLLRTKLFQLDTEEYLLVLNIHQIILDDWSKNILIHELWLLYKELISGEVTKLPELPFRYVDFLSLKCQFLESEELQTQISYWKKQLANIPPQLDLPTDYPRSTQATYRGKNLIFSLTKDCSRKLLQFNEQTGISPFISLLTIFSILVNRYTRQEDIVIEILSPERLGTDFKNLVGPISSILLLRTDLSENPNFREQTERINDLVQDAYAHQKIPYTMLTEELKLDTDHRMFPLAQVLFKLEEDATTIIELDRLNIKVNFTYSETSKHELSLSLRQTEDAITGNIEYNSNLYDESSIRRMAEHFVTLADSALSNANQPIANLKVLTDRESYELLTEITQHTNDYPHEKTVHQLFEEQVKHDPDAVAIVFEGKALSYQELNKQANQLSHYLQDQGVGRDTVVGVCIERSIEMVVCLIAILKAGGSYLPLDPQYPKQRLSYMIENANLRFILSQSGLGNLMPDVGIKVLYIDSDWSIIRQQKETSLISSITPESIAYVIYTSGSTGQPKGVVMNHSPLVNLLVWQARDTPLPPGSRTLQFAPVSFDVSFQEIFSTLCFGGTLILITDQTRRDPLELLQTVNINNIDRLFLPFVALQSLAEVAIRNKILCPTLKHVITAGEQLLITPSIRDWFSLNSHLRLHNQYGPSETHVVTSYTLDIDTSTWILLPPIGFSVSNIKLYILDSQLQLVPKGVVGLLYVQVDDLLRGYISRPDLTNERYIANPFSASDKSRLYKTGDLVRYLPDGTIQFLGRVDNQVKIRGYRIELGEIESSLNQHPAVKQCVVSLRDEEGLGSRLIAYIVTKKSESSHTSGDLQNFLGRILPEYMIPSVFVELDSLPLSPSGKVDRRALPDPIDIIPENHRAYSTPRTEIESLLSNIWKRLLKLERVGIHENFFDLGGNSLLSIRLVTMLQEEMNLTLPVVKLFQNPTISDLSDYLSGLMISKPRSKNISIEQSQKGLQRDAVAIVGMAGRFPGANDVNHLWENLCEGISSITFFGDEDLDISISDELKSNPNYIKAKGILNGADLFDASFFGISPREAQMMDPQHRVFLEVAYEALEEAGYDPDRFDGQIGLYAGSGNNTYFSTNLSHKSDLVDQLGEFQIMLGNDKDFLTSRVSYKLNLKGPSISINTACSTSLVAVVHAFNSLLNHECDLALAGGISISTPLNSGYLYQEGGMLSPDGYCRPFDAKAQGTLFSNGVGIVVLKRLDEALDDGDHIVAVIRGVGINNDGSNKVSFTAPSVNGQAQAIRKTLDSANINPESISYIETHGTATPIGDPIEITALTEVFRSQTNAVAFCAIGSVKSNLGHLASAAGVTGLIKTSLALKHKLIPPTLHYQSPNPNIDFINSPFYVNTKLIDWQTEHLPRRAGVSSFGVGGTNAHVLLEEWIGTAESSESRPKHLLLLSAKSITALNVSSKRLADQLKLSNKFKLADVAYTLQVGRRELPYRRFIICENQEEAVELLEQEVVSQNLSAAAINDRTPEIVFMFPGQGSQYPMMGSNLYQHEPIFKEIVDECAEILLPYLGEDLRDLLYPKQDILSPFDFLIETRIAQPAIFTLEYALAKLWNHWGVYPQIMIGHSIGELVAACLAEVFSLEDALKIVALRGQLMQNLPRGSMLSVKLRSVDLEKRLNAKLTIAAINGPSLCIVSGPSESVQQLQDELEREEIACKYLHTSHAFHSSMMDPILEPFSQICRGISLSDPKIPIVSSVTGQLLTSEEATDPLYWAQQLRKTVRFAEGIKTIWQQPDRILLEIGTRTTTATLARQQAYDLSKQIAISSLGSSEKDSAELTALLQAIGQLWLSGISIDWQKYYLNEIRNRLSLPTYPFDRKRYWIDPKPCIKLSAMDEASSGKLNALSEVVATNHNLLTKPVMEENQNLHLLNLVKEVLQGTSGLDLEMSDPLTTFIEMGLDSLSLTQVAIGLSKKFGLKITFRMLLEECTTLDALIKFIQPNLPEGLFPRLVAANPSVTDHSMPSPISESGSLNITSSQKSSSYPSGSLEALVAQQLELMSRQLELLSKGRVAQAAPINTIKLKTNSTLQSLAEPSKPVSEDSPLKQVQPAFGPGTKIAKAAGEQLTPKQHEYLDRFVAKYTKLTAESKRQTQDSRAYLADPRTASGFTPLLKELVYPIITERSDGSKLWDVDGNEYIDLTNGFGSNFFGWSTPFIKEAIEKQLSKGIEIGPQTPLASNVARMISELTGMERVAFCNTGSEAVMAAMRLARTVTGRSLIAIFKGAYHGTIDEVIVRVGTHQKSFPAAPGLLPSMFENIIVLDYGTTESLQLLRERADEFAAIMVEPVQSRCPEVQPKEFLQELRRLTDKSGAAYIFDEVVTGFRVHPGGAQAYFDVRADLATYGKVIGGGLPIGIVSGKREYMDALDGGFWQYGDHSIPEVGVTFFAGTFVRHPLALSAAEAALKYLKKEGVSLQRALNQRMDKFVSHLKHHFVQVHAPIRINHFSSFFYITFPPDVSHGNLLFYVLRQKGVHIWEHRPCFFSLAHTDDDIAFLTHAFKEAVLELQVAGFLTQRGSNIEGSSANSLQNMNGSKPHPSARLGKDQNGNPAWFIPDPDRPGKYLKFLTF